MFFDLRNPEVVIRGESWKEGKRWGGKGGGGGEGGRVKKGEKKDGVGLVVG